MLVERDAVKWGAGTEVDFGAFDAFAFEVAVFVRLAVVSFSRLSSLLEVVSLLSSLAGCLRLLPTAVAADLVVLALDNGVDLEGGASAMSTSESLPDEELSEGLDCLARVVLVFASAVATTLGVGTPIGMNRGRRFGGCSLAGLVWRT